MKNLRSKTKRLLSLLITVLGLFLVPVIVLGQGASADQKTPTSLTGKYEGNAKGPGGDVKMTLDLIDDAGKFSGQVTTPSGAYKVVKGQMVDGLLTLEFDDKGAVAKLAVRQKDDTLVGDLTVRGQTGAIELRKAAKEEISGEWDAAADVQGQAFPFALSLKVEGDKVTGSSSSQLGNSTVSSGSWKDGKLALVLESGTGQIALIGTMVDGKLVGDFDYGGQLSGKWVATKKKP